MNKTDKARKFERALRTYYSTINFDRDIAALDDRLTNAMRGTLSAKAILTMSAKIIESLRELQRSYKDEKGKDISLEEMSIAVASILIELGVSADEVMAEEAEKNVTRKRGT